MSPVGSMQWRFGCVLTSVVLATLSLDTASAFAGDLIGAELMGGRS